MKLKNENKYSTTPEFNKLRARSFLAWLKEAKFASKADINDFNDKLKNINKKFPWNKTRSVLVNNL